MARETISPHPRISSISEVQKCLSFNDFLKEDELFFGRILDNLYKINCRNVKTQPFAFPLENGIYFELFFSHVVVFMGVCFNSTYLESLNSLTIC